MLAIRKPMERMLQVLISSAMVNEKRNVHADRVVALARENHQGQRGRSEEQLDDDVRGKNGLRAQRRGAQPFEDAAFAVDGDNGDQRQHRADGDQKRSENRQARRE